MKFNCKDELVELLKQKGYSLVSLPKENLAPLQILERTEKGVLAWIQDVFTTPVVRDKNAKLGELFITDSQPLPIPTPGDVINDVKGKRSSEMSVEAGVALMMDFLNLPEEEKTESRKLGIKAAFQSVDKVNFSFGGDAQDQSVSEVALDSYLKDAEIRDEVGYTFRDRIDGNQLYIVTSILKSNSFTIKGMSDSSASVSLDIPKIYELLEGKIEGSLDVFEQSGMKYKGIKQLVFGFKAVRLLAKKDGENYSFKIKSKEGLALKGEEDFPVEVLNEGTNFIELS